MSIPDPPQRQTRGSAMIPNKPRANTKGLRPTRPSCRATGSPVPVPTRLLKPRRAGDTIPVTGIPAPTRPGWKALIDVKSRKQLEVITWILRKLERGHYIGPSLLAREVGIKKQTASRILYPKNERADRVPGWVEWARYVLGIAGTASSRREDTLPQELRIIKDELREPLGTETFAKEPTEGIEETRSCIGTREPK